MRAVVPLAAISKHCPCKAGGGHIWPAKGSQIALAPLASELDVKVSLHPAQASQRPCDGPVSSHTTCWLHDTTQKSMPLRGREHQCDTATVICNAFCVDSSVILVLRHRREVCPLARRVMLPRPRAQPVSTPLQGGLRFFPPLYPHGLWLAWR